MSYAFVIAVMRTLAPVFVDVPQNWAEASWDMAMLRSMAPDEKRMIVVCRGETSLRNNLGGKPNPKVVAIPFIYRYLRSPRPIFYPMDTLTWGGIAIFTK